MSIWKIIINWDAAPESGNWTEMLMQNNLIEAIGPVHPGEVLGEDVLPTCGLSKSEFARRLNISREALNNVLNRKSAVSTVLALKLSRLLGTSPQVWLNLQQAFDLARISEMKREEIDSVKALSS